MTRSNHGTHVHPVDKMPRMDTKQHALAAEIRAEMAAQRVSTRQMHEAAGVSSSAWNNYFVKCTRDVPIAVVIAVADRLGLTGSELLRRAEARAGQSDPAPDLSEHITRQLSPEAQAQVRAARAQMTERSRRGQPNV